MTINPDILVLIICIMAFLIGSCLFICLYSICYIIGSLLQYFFPDDLPLTKLGPDTHVGCPDRLCYLHMFMSKYHDLITRKLGHFPFILALSTVSKLYQRNLPEESWNQLEMTWLNRTSKSQDFLQTSQRIWLYWIIQPTKPQRHFATPWF